MLAAGVKFSVVLSYIYFVILFYQVGSILFETNFIISIFNYTQLAIRIASCVIMKFVSKKLIFTLLNSQTCIFTDIFI